FFQIYLTFPLIQVFFLLLGIMISTIVSRVSSPLPLALGISFGSYVIGLFSNVIQSTIARLFSPFRYFDAILVLTSENYESGYLVLFFFFFFFFFFLYYLLIFFKYNVIYIILCLN